MAATPAIAPALAHDAIEQAFDDIWTVRGRANMGKMQITRRMTIVRHNGELTLISAVRLSDAALTELEKLGYVRVTVCVRLQAMRLGRGVCVSALSGACGEADSVACRVRAQPYHERHEGECPLLEPFVPRAWATAATARPSLWLVPHAVTWLRLCVCVRQPGGASVRRCVGVSDRLPPRRRRRVLRPEVQRPLLGAGKPPSGQAERPHGTM